MVISLLLLIGIFILIYKNRKAITTAVTNWINPITGYITSKFGYRTNPVSGETGTFHNGIDLSVPVGTPIKAPYSGEVIDINSGGSGGNEIIIKHDNGYKTGYAHLSQINVILNQKIKQGDIIGLTGNTGNSTGPHLHFTLTNLLGIKIDPLTVFTFA